MEDARFRQKRLSNAVIKLDERLTQVLAVEEDQRRQIAYDEAQVERDKLAAERPVANARDTSGVLGQPCGGFQSAEGMTLTIHGTPNLSMREPKPGDQKVSPNGMACLPPSES